MNVGDEAVGRVADALVAEVKKWPMDSSLPWDSRVGVGATFHELARAALEAAAPLLPPTREQIAEALHGEKHSEACLFTNRSNCGEWHASVREADSVLALFDSTTIYRRGRPNHE